MDSKRIALAIGGAAATALAVGAFVIFGGDKSEVAPAQPERAANEAVDEDYGDSVVIDAEIIESIAATDLPAAHAQAQAPEEIAADASEQAPPADATDTDDQGTADAAPDQADAEAGETKPPKQKRRWF